MRSIVVALLLCAAAGSAAAEETATHARGRELYMAGRYNEALAAFRESYAQGREPRVLVDIAHCHRRMGQYEPALQHYRAYLSADPGSSSRAEVEKWIADTEAEQRSAAPQVTPPPPGPGQYGYYPAYGYGYVPAADPRLRLETEKRRHGRGVGTTVAGLVLLGTALILGGTGAAFDRISDIAVPLYVFSALTGLASIPCLIVGPIVWADSKNKLRTLQAEIDRMQPKGIPSASSGAGLAFRF